MEVQKPIRILHVLTRMNYGGTETMIMNLYRKINREEIQFDFAVSSALEGDYDKEILSLGGIIHHYPRYTGLNHFCYTKWWKSFFEKNKEYHIVHGHIGSTAAIYLSIAKKYHCFTIAHSHSTGRKYTIHSMLYRLYAYPTRYIADFFFGCSTEALVARYGLRTLKNPNHCILKNGIDIQKFSDSKVTRVDILEELNISDRQALIVGTVGRMTDAKNPFFIIDILNELKQKDANFIFIWVGTGELLAEIKDRINECGLQNNVKLLGIRNDVHRILKAFNVFILPSKYEGLPLVGIEVQVEGVPFLCSENVSKEVAVTQCCRFLPVDSPELWASEILKEKAFRRFDNTKELIIGAGFDINQTSKWLSSFYKGL